jgi:hypothetical protein
MGTCTAETDRRTDRRNSAKHKEIGQHVAAFHHMEKGKKEKIKMKVQKGWPHDMAGHKKQQQHKTRSYSKSYSHSCNCSSLSVAVSTER